MDKQAQDKRWNGLSEREQAGWLENYKCNKEDGNKESMKIIEELFGSHNLNPKPKTPKTPKTPKIWEDVEKEYPKILTDFQELNVEITCCCGIENKIGNKMLATAKIAKLIDLGYGGMVSEEEWKDLNIPKYCIIYHPTCQDERLKFDDDEEIPTKKHFIAFHTPEQRKEFMSYESNRQLVQQYFMM